MTFEEFLQAELEELRHWSNDPELQFEPSYINRMRRAYNVGKQQWRPIETALKSNMSEHDDIDMLLLYIPHDIEDWGYVTTGYWNSNTGCWCNNANGGKELPSLWMPLTEPPKGER